VLKRIAGCEEWGVRVTGAARQAAREAAPEVTSGTAFLAARKKLRDNARAAVVKAASTAAAVFDELAPLSKDARRRSDTPPGAVPPLLDAAFLVPFGKRAKFRTAARRASKMCTAAGVTLTLTGPWPAYNFVQPPGEPR
jgi:hypothetical protein